MAQVNPETALGEGNVSGRTIGTAASRRRASLTKSISVLVAKTQTGGYKLEVDPLMPLVISSGVVLAACAGMVNAIAFETSETLVSHVTGAVSKVSLHTVGEHAHAGKMVLLVSFFLLGSMISGCIIKRTAVKMAYMGYGVAMTASALLLISSLLVFKASEDAAVYILCVISSNSVYWMLAEWHHVLLHGFGHPDHTHDGHRDRCGTHYWEALGVLLQTKMLSQDSICR